MQFLVRMRLVSPGRPATSEEGIAFIERLVLPTLAACRLLQREGIIVGGGPISGAVGLCLLVEADSAQQLDSLITRLPLWPRMKTEVIPLSTFDAREQSVRRMLESLQAGLPKPGQGR